MDFLADLNLEKYYFDVDYSYSRVILISNNYCKFAIIYILIC